MYLNFDVSLMDFINFVITFVPKMISMRLSRFLFLVAVFSSFHESQTCFTYNETLPVDAIKSGDSYIKDCDCENPQLSTENIYWVSPNGTLIGPPRPGSEVFTERGSSTISLTIPSANTGLSGVYKCISTALNGTKYAKSFELDVYEPMDFDLTVPNNCETPQYIVIGQNALIRCSAKGHVKPDIYWYKRYYQDFNAIEKSDNKYEYKEDGLLIKNAVKDDEGEYRCTAGSAYTSENIETLIKVEVMTTPKVEDVIAYPSFEVIEGDNVTLDCRATGYPLPDYTWRKVVNETESAPGSPVTDATHVEQKKTWQQNFNKLIFESITMDDQGAYECIAKNQAGESRQQISIGVLAEPRITVFENQTVAEGAQVTIICEATGRPRPEINIFYHRPDMEFEQNYNIDNSNPTKEVFIWTFNKVQRNQEDNFTCNATNKVGSDSKSMYLEVMYKPFFEENTRDEWIWDENPRNLTCDYQSHPASHVRWTYQGNTDLITLRETREDINYWTERVKNTTAPYLTINMDSNKKLFYGKYVCTANNSFGMASKIFVVKQGTLPPKLMDEQVNVTNVAATSAAFTVNGNWSGGPPIHGYTAEYDTVENYGVTSIHDNRTWAANVPIKLDKLKRNTYYRIRFAAINPVGTGPYGQYIDFVTPDKSAPEPPEFEHDSEPVLIPDDNKILKLKAAEHNGDSIDYYAIKYCPMDVETDCIEEQISPTSEVSLDHLSHNTSYIVEMVAHNSIGNSTPTTLRIIMGEDLGFILMPGAIIGIAVIIVFICLVVLDLILFLTLKKGMIANCVYKRNKNKKEGSKQSRDKKGLLKDNAEATNNLKRPDDSGPKEFEYNKNTGVITGKHSAV